MGFIIALVSRLLIVTAAILVWGASLVYVLKNEAPLGTKLELLWNEDLKLLESSKALPEGWFDVGTIETHAGTDNAKLWLKDISIPLKIKEKGQYTLEVLLVDWVEGPKTGAMIQYNLVDHKSGNMVWELGRTLILKDENSLYQKARTHIMNWLRH